MVGIELPGRQKRGRPQRGFTDVVKEDTQRAGVTEEDARDRMRWRQMTHRVDP